MKKVLDNIYYVGCNDHNIDLFEGHYDVPNGMAYNSYVIMDEKITIMDTIDINFFDEWFSKIEKVLGDKKPTYLVVQHMEPDHSANIINLLEKYPDLTIVGNEKTFKMIDQFFHVEIPHKLEVKDGDELNLGKTVLKFVFAPMIHWPEVMMTYDLTHHVFFSADAFGKFGALDVDEDWACEARRYYIGIVGKYGPQVQMLLKKAASLDIKMILPLHGPILDKDLGYYLHLYDVWSGYKVESEGVAIFYTSVYGHTKEAVMLLAERLRELGCPKVVVNDLAREDMAECTEDAFRYGKIVLATTTYNMSIFPYMNSFIETLVERNYQNRMIGFIENGSWAPASGRIMKEKLSGLKDITFVEPMVKILSAIDDVNREQIDELARALLGEAVAPKEGKKTRKWMCKVCGFIYEGDELPEDFSCPLCGHPRSDFEEIFD